MTTDDRLVRPTAEGDEREFEQSLRPQRLAEYIGQERVKSNLSVFLRAARQRGEALDHVLLSGPPGLGKTTLAHVIAREMEVDIKVTSGPSIEKPGDLAAILTNLKAGDVLFVDEIHRLSRTMEEILYPALEDFASTRVGSLTAPLRERFGIVHHLEYYRPEDLAAIASRSARILGVPLDPSGAQEIARRSRGTPRIANRLLKRVRDFVQVDGGDRVTEAAAAAALERLEVDAYGLDLLDRRILSTILEKFDGGPVGLATLAAAVGEDRETIEEIYEPYLLQIGFLDRTHRGRRATRRAREHLRSRGGSAPSLF